MAKSKGYSLALSAAVILLGLLGAGQAAHAQGTRIDLGRTPENLIPSRMLVGDWLTIIRTDERPQPLRLQIHTVEPGKTAGKLIYSSPKRCTIDLEYGGPDGDEHIFYMVPFTNCFRYGKADYVAFTAAEPASSTSSDLTRQAGDYRLMAKDQKASAGAEDADPPNKKAPKEAQVRAMQYVINIGGRRIELGLLTRQ